MPNWLTTHSQPDDRAARAGELVKKARTAASATPFIVDRDGYLAPIDGIVFGDNPEDGIVRGNIFLHSPLRFVLAFLKDGRARSSRLRSSTCASPATRRQT